MGEERRKEREKRKRERERRIERKKKKRKWKVGELLPHISGIPTVGTRRTKK